METIHHSMGTALVEFERERGGQAWNATGKVKIGTIWIKLCPDCLEKLSPSIITGGN